MQRLLQFKRNRSELSATFFLLFVVSLCFSACRSNSAQSATTTGTDAPSSTEVIKTKFSEEFPRTIKVKLTVSRRQDLKVKVNSHLNQGDVLTDRAEERAALLNQRKVLEFTLSRFEAGETVNNAKELPPQFFADDLAKIKRAEILLSTIRAKIKHQTEKLDAVRRMNFADSVVSHEQSKLDELLQKAIEAESEIELTRAEFDSAKEKRKFIEFENNVRLRREETEAGKTKQQIEISAAQTRAQILAIDEKLLTVAVVRSPFPATVERVVWEGQQNNEILITLHLVVDDVQRDRAGN